MDDKKMQPLRQEDYQATAEENRRLKAEVEKLKPKAKPETELRPRRRWPARILLALMVSGGLAALVSGIDAGCAYRTRRLEHEASPVVCYSVQQPRVWDEGEYRNSLPWEPYRIWEYRSLHYSSMRVLPNAGPFANWDEATAFANKWKLKVCP